MSNKKKVTLVHAQPFTLDFSSRHTSKATEAQMSKRSTRRGFTIDFITATQANTKMHSLVFPCFQVIFSASFPPNEPGKLANSSIYPLSLLPCSLFSPAPSCEIVCQLTPLCSEDTLSRQIHVITRAALSAPVSAFASSALRQITVQIIIHSWNGNIFLVSACASSLRYLLSLVTGYLRRA